MEKKSLGSVDPQEIAKFSAMAEDWWNPQGKFRPLHLFNPTRLKYIRDQAVSHFRLDATQARPLAGLRILDIGCGGGLLCEPLTRLGAAVTGIDAADKNIAIARLHAEQVGLNVSYLACPIEAMPMKADFDIILAMEIVEHVADANLFYREAVARLKPGGLLFVATLNRTLKSYAFAILGAEYILRWLPKGTHDWKKFVRPSEMVEGLRSCGLDIVDLTGVAYSPLRDDWQLTRNLDINYMVTTAQVGA